MARATFFSSHGRVVLAIAAVLVSLLWNTNPLAWAKAWLSQVSREVDSAAIQAALSTFINPPDLAKAEQKLQVLEVELKSTFEALPKNKEGRLGHRAVRHVLSSYFAKDHGLHFKGLEPSGMQRAPVKALHEISILKDRAPRFARALMEAEHTELGLEVKDVLAVMIALEHLIVEDHERMLKTSWRAHNLSFYDTVNTTTVNSVFDYYMFMLWDGMEANYSKPGKLQEVVRNAKQGPQQVSNLFQEVHHYTREFLDKPEYFNRDRANPFVHRTFDYNDAAGLMRQMASNYGKWQDESCLKIKKELVDFDPHGSGRVPLTTFYNAGKNPEFNTVSHFFTESEAYLQITGTLDNTLPDSPEVIISNYVTGPSNCVAPSKFFQVCCLPECHHLMARIEGQIRAPSAPPQKLLDIARNLTTATMEAPRRFPKRLVSKLWMIAEQHGGEVPIHGRLFAQWMHYANPWECPFPEVVNPAAFHVNFWSSTSATASAEDIAEYRMMAKDQKLNVSNASLKQWKDDDVLPIHEIEEAYDFAEIVDMLHSACRVAIHAAVLFAMLNTLRAAWQTLRQALQPRQKEEWEYEVEKPSKKQRRKLYREAEYLKKRSEEVQRNKPSVAEVGATASSGAGKEAKPMSDEGTSSAAKETCTYCGHVGSETKYVSTLCVSGCKSHHHKTCWRKKHGGLTLQCAPRRCACGELLERIEVYEHVGGCARLVHTIQNEVVEEDPEPEPTIAAAPVAMGRKQKAALKRQAAGEAPAAEAPAAPEAQAAPEAPAESEAPDVPEGSLASEEPVPPEKEAPTASEAPASPAALAAPSTPPTREVAAAEKQHVQSEAITTGKAKSQNGGKKQSRVAADSPAEYYRPPGMWQQPKSQWHSASWSSKWAATWNWTQQTLQWERRTVPGSGGQHELSSAPKRSNEWQYEESPAPKRSWFQSMEVEVPGWQPQATDAGSACSSHWGGPLSFATHSRQESPLQSAVNEAKLSEIDIKVSQSRAIAADSSYRKLARELAGEQDSDKAQLSPSKLYTLPPAPQQSPPPPPPPGLEQHSISPPPGLEPCAMEPPPGLSLQLGSPAPSVTAMKPTFCFNPPPGFENFQAPTLEEHSGAFQVGDIPEAQANVSPAELFQEEAERKDAEEKAAEEAAKRAAQAAKKAKEEAEAKAKAEAERQKAEAQRQKAQEAEQKRREVEETASRLAEAAKRVAEKVAAKKAEAEAVAKAAREKMEEAAKVEKEHRDLLANLTEATEAIERSAAKLPEEVLSVKQPMTSPVYLEDEAVVGSSPSAKPCNRWTRRRQAGDAAP